MTWQLQRRFSNNIATLCGRLLIDVLFATLLQRRDMVERRHDLKATALQRRHDVVCLLGVDINCLEIISHYIKKILHANTYSKANQSWNKNKEI